MTWHGSHKTAPPELASFRTLAWRRRLLLAAVAVSGTAAYSASFRTLPPAREMALSAAADAVGAAAAVSWLVFGCLLLIAHQRPAPLAWADACLRAMAAGVAVLACGAALNVCAAPRARAGLILLPVAHGLVLAAANVVMAVVFCREARRLGVRPPAALLTWAVGLDGVFALVLLSFYRNGVFVP